MIVRFADIGRIVDFRLSFHYHRKSRPRRLLKHFPKRSNFKRCHVIEAILDFPSQKNLNFVHGILLCDKRDISVALNGLTTVTVNVPM